MERRKINAALYFFTVITNTHLTQFSVPQVQFLSNFLNEAFRGIETFSSYSRVQASPNWYFKKLGNFYSTLASRHPKDIDTLKDYVIWRVVDRYVSAMPSQFTDVKRAFMDTILGPRSSHRWVDCINEMMTPLDMPLGLLFVDSHFEEESKQTVRHFKP